MLFDKDKIITYDQEGWPIEKKTLREILKSIGFVDNPETGKFEIDSSMDILECFPMTIEDDGMGYGTNGKYITDSYTFNQGMDLNLFIDSELKGINYFVEDNVPAFVNFQYNDKNVYLIAFDEEKDCYVAKSEENETLFITRNKIKELFKVGN